jgi:hypothetical protein
VGSSYRIEIAKPDASLYSWVDFTAPDPMRGGYHLWGWYAAPWITPADDGVWTLRVLVGGHVLQSRTFTVGASTAFGPRFRRSGRSFRIDGTTQRDTLRLTPLGGPAAFSLLDAPSFVTLTDSVLAVGPVSNQTHRSRYFKAIATGPLARRDTAIFHVVDPTKPLDPVTVGVANEGPPTIDGLWLAAPAPNPTRGETRFRFFLDRPGPVELAVFDLLGRRVRLLEQGAREAGAHAVAWDGLDDAGRPAAAGIYLVRLESAAGRRTVRVVRGR